MNYEERQLKLEECCCLGIEAKEKQGPWYDPDEHPLDLEDAKKRLHVQQRYLGDLRKKVENLEAERDHLQELVDSIDWDQQRAGRDILSASGGSAQLSPEFNPAEEWEILRHNPALHCDSILEEYKGAEGRWLIFPYQGKVHIKFPTPQKLVSMTVPGANGIAQTLLKWAEHIEQEGNN